MSQRQRICCCKDCDDQNLGACIVGCVCSQQTECDCNDLGGQWYRGKQCVDVQSLGRCCLPDGSCVDVPCETDCLQLGGIFTQGIRCAGNPCTCRDRCEQLGFPKRWNYLAYVTIVYRTDINVPGDPCLTGSEEYNDVQPMFPICDPVSGDGCSGSAGDYAACPQLFYYAQGLPPFTLRFFSRCGGPDFVLDRFNSSRVETCGAATYTTSIAFTIQCFEGTCCTAIPAQTIPVALYYRQTGFCITPPGAFDYNSTAFVTVGEISPAFPPGHPCCRP